MEDTYENAYVQVLEILNYVPKKELEKIPIEEIEFFQKNKNVDYKYSYNGENPILLRKTYIILVSLYRNYLATVSQKSKINESKTI